MNPIRCDLGQPDVRQKTCVVTFPKEHGWDHHFRIYHGFLQKLMSCSLLSLPTYSSFHSEICNRSWRCSNCLLLELKYIDFPEKTLGFVFGWLDFCSSSPALHCVWHLAILRCACSVQPACVSLWPWSSCTKFGASLLWEPRDYMDQRTKTKSSLKRVKAAKSLRVEG